MRGAGGCEESAVHVHDEVLDARLLCSTELPVGPSPWLPEMDKCRPRRSLAHLAELRSRAQE